MMWCEGTAVGLDNCLAGEAAAVVGLAGLQLGSAVGAVGHGFRSGGRRDRATRTGTLP